jgi:site-specific recombinase XerD
VSVVAVLARVPLIVQGTSGAAATGQLVADYATYVAGLAINPDGKRLRRRNAEHLVGAHPDLWAWLGRSTQGRLVDLSRSHAWPLISWAWVNGRLPIDLDLMLAARQHDLYALWASTHPEDVARVAGCAAALSWSATWTRQVSVVALAVVALHAGGKTLAELTDDDITACTDALAAAPSLTRTMRGHNTARVFGLHHACYQLRICHRPPRMARRPAATIEEMITAGVPQLEIRRVALRYLAIVATTLRPGTLTLRADSLIVFCEYLAAAHPEVRRLPQLTRAHLEDFLTYNHRRPWRGRVARDKPVAASVSKRAVVDLRAFFDDLAVWGWAERPAVRLLHPGDIPRLDRPLPRALAPDHDRDLMAAVDGLADPFARHGLTILRGTGLRLGELLDLELDCVLDFASHGSWLKVPLGKLGTERTVPLDEFTLAALADWTAQRGIQRALPHPRHGQPTDFLFVERGRRPSAYRLRQGLDDAAAAAGLRGRAGAPLHVTPHQLRHTYGTALINGGMSLQALMALLGHVSAEMTLRYASLASPTVRVAYDQAMSKARSRLTLPIAPVGQPIVPDRVQWLRAEMLKTRLAHGYCSRSLAAEACSYANICEQCDNFTTSVEFVPALQSQLTDVTALREDAEARGWDTEVARHARVISNLTRHLDRLAHSEPPKLSHLTVPPRAG